jgi:predicted DNA-binding transcriptional regulator AlpA
MSTSILFTDTQENFYGQLKELIQTAIKQELSAVKKEDSEIAYIKKDEVCKLLRVSKPTVDSHVEKGFYKKHSIGSRVFYNKQEILSYLNQNNKLVATSLNTK